MPNNITHKTSTTPSVVPPAVQLTAGELAVNAADGKVYTRKADGTVVDLTDLQVMDGGAQFTPLDIANTALWLDAADTTSLYTTDAGAVTAITAPTDIAGCRLWLDADDASTFTLVSNAVAEWRDKSNSGVPHATQTSATFRPVRTLNAVNNRAAVVFQTSHLLSFANSTAAFNFLHNNVGGTIFIVIRPYSSINPNTFAYILNNSNNNSGSVGVGISFDDRSSLSRNNAVLINVNRGVSGTPASSSTINNFLTTTDNYALLSVVLNNANATAANRASVLLDGIAATAANTNTASPATTNATTDMIIGSLGTPTAEVGGIDGGIAEIIFYEGALSAATRARVEKYLALKWGLPDTHRSVAQELTPVASPLSLPDCALWLDADQTVTPSFFDATTGGNAVTVHNSAIARWADKSGNNRHATQATTANQPLFQLAGFNGKSCVRSDGTRWLVAQNTNINSRAVTVFTVYRINTWEIGVVRPQNLYHTNFGDPSFSTNNGIRSEQYNNGMDIRIGASSGTGNALGFSNFTSTEQGQTRIQAARMLTAGQAVARVSGVQRTSGTVSAVNIPTGFGSNVALFTGFNQNVDRILVGDIAEFIIYGRALTDSEVQRVESYLANKWSITNATPPAPPVGYWVDKSGNNRHATQATAASRPALGAPLTGSRCGVSFGTTGNAQRLGWLPSSGTQNWRELIVVGIYDVTATTFPDLSTIFSGFNTNSGTGLGIGITGEQSQNAITTTFGTFLPQISFNNRDVFPASAARPFPTINSRFFVLGRSSGDTAVAGYVVGNDRQFSSGRNWRGRIAEVIAFERQLTPAERNRIIDYLAAKWSINVVPQVANLDAQDWINRVYLAGGTVSPGTAAAVNNFCNAIDAAGIRDRFYRLNLFCGDNLTACLVPLYRGPSLTATQLGNATDTNNNFAASDYNERGVGGLRGDGSSKYLNTGLSISNIGTFSSGHLSVYHGQSSGSSTNRYYIAANDAITNNRYWFGTGAFSSALVVGFYGHVFTASESLPAFGHGTAGHRILSRTASNSLTHYHNGSVVATDTNDVTGGAGTLSTAAFSVFARNNNGTIDQFHNSWIAAYSIGLGLDATQAAAYRTAMQTFQAALSRSV